MESEEQRKQALDEELKKGTAFEELVRTKGWEYLQAYFQNKLQSFANELLLSEDKAIAIFENKRQELIALKKLMGQVSNSLQTLENYRKAQKEQNDKQQS